MKKQKEDQSDTNYNNFISDIKKLLDSDLDLTEIVVIRNIDGKLEEQHIIKENGK